MVSEPWHKNFKGQYKNFKKVPNLFKYQGAICPNQWLSTDSTPTLYWCGEKVPASFHCFILHVENNYVRVPRQHFLPIWLHVFPRQGPEIWNQRGGRGQFWSKACSLSSPNS